MSIENFSGTVRTVTEKPFTDRDTGQPITLYSFQVDGVPKWFRTGRTKPNFSNGDYIKFVAKGQNVRVSDVTVSEGNEVARAPAPPRPKAKGAENWDARQAYWEAKEKRDLEVVEPRITYSAAERDAVTVIDTALKHEAIKLPTKVGDRLDFMLEAIDQVAERIYRRRITGNFPDTLGEGTSTPAEEVPEGGEDEYGY
jgi:hypothetical protein